MLFAGAAALPLGAGGKLEIVTDLSGEGAAAAYSNCRCEKIKRGAGCSPACFLHCSLGGAFEDIQSFMDSECYAVFEQSVADEKTSLAGLKSVYKSAERKIKELKNKKGLLPKKESCGHCHEISKIQNLTQPYIYKENSCDEKYIGTSHFQKTFEAGNPEKCAEHDKSGQRKKCEKAEKAKERAVQKYVENILKNKGSGETKAEAARLHESCPPGAKCSWYVSSIMTYNEDRTLVDLDLQVSCNHKKASLFGDYVVKISYKRERICREKAPEE